ncbi:MAG: hypothetical protein RLN90_09540 [Balneolaceae bacterium]
MYRLSVLLEVSWTEFERLELWQIRSRAFVKGEDVVQQKCNELDVHMASFIASKSEKPFEEQHKFEEAFKKAITIEYELSPQEYLEWAAEQNRIATEDL